MVNICTVLIIYFTLILGLNHNVRELFCPIKWMIILTSAAISVPPACEVRITHYIYQEEINFQAMHLNLRSHLPFTSMYPGAHMQLYDPGVFMHCVLLKQSCVLFKAAALHSSTSSN